MLQIYCGEGKGKTTASLGLALRMAGAGMKVAFVQFMKGGDTAELNSLAKIENIDVMRCDRDYGFFNTLSDSDKAELAACHNGSHTAKMTFVPWIPNIQIREFSIVQTRVPIYVVPRFARGA